jgi:hypothetical protein
MKKDRFEKAVIGDEIAIFHTITMRLNFRGRWSSDQPNISKGQKYFSSPFFL